MDENKISNPQTAVVESTEEVENQESSRTSWKEFWKNEELASPDRSSVFPNGEDKNMSDEEVVESLNRYFEKQGSSLFNMTGIDSEQFPEMIDKDIRELCQKLNKLPFLKTREGCSGHETYQNGEISNLGYSEPYLVFYAEEENPEFHKLLDQINKKLQQLRESGLPGIENVVLNSRKEDWLIKTKGFGLYRCDMGIIPTKEWCEKNNKKYIQRPESPGPLQDWCQENGFEYLDDEEGNESEARKKWEEEKKKYWKKAEEFGNEYGEYFRSDEVRKLRDEFFKAFEYEGKKENESDETPESQKKWDKVKDAIENSADSLGLEIDEGIKNPIIALNAFEINTDQSCEGHLDSGKSAPWIRIEAPNEPEERFINQNETFKKVAEKYNMPLEEAKRMFNPDAYWEAMKISAANGETKDYQKWREESGKLLYVTKDILNDFYKNRQVSEDIKIKIDTESADDMAEGSFVIFNGGEDYRDINDVQLSEEERKSLEQRLSEYREEMQAFAEFLKNKFFSEGESYVNSKRNKAQDKMDQEKIQKIREKVS